MARKFAQQFYNSKAWQKTREAYKHYAGGICERCYRDGMIKPGELVHHIKPITPENINDPNITLSFDNLELVCADCHAQEHKEIYARRRKRRYIVDPDGKVHGII